jgi:hypothetical protein
MQATGISRLIFPMQTTLPRSVTTVTVISRAFLNLELRGHRGTRRSLPIMKSG